MILAIVVDTEGNEGTAYELAQPAPVENRLDVIEELGAFPFSGPMLSAMLPGVASR